MPPPPPSPPEVIRVRNNRDLGAQVRLSRLLPSSSFTAFLPSSSVLSSLFFLPMLPILPSSSLIFLPILLFFTSLIHFYIHYIPIPIYRFNYPFIYLITFLNFHHSSSSSYPSSPYPFSFSLFFVVTKSFILSSSPTFPFPPHPPSYFLLLLLHVILLTFFPFFLNSPPFFLSFFFYPFKFFFLLI